ncbi:hypothetical protein [Clostridium isatidis]|uniref:Uncharacterized protein n=1 Tax=Clostridium isatidis TaxID=182773 RepID=A0A343JEB0_9CLOT|nr:hypothetical protein [Clostridium isatidis]ASW43868.1 hypothetical protein BEN51_10340 [Clostridium isatidis]
MKFKIGNMNSQKIINNIFTTALIYFIIIILKLFMDLSIVPGKAVAPEMVKFYNIIHSIKTIMTPILGIILFKLICEILYKILKACEIIIQNDNNKND